MSNCVHCGSPLASASDDCLGCQATSLYRSLDLRDIAILLEANNINSCWIWDGYLNNGTPAFDSKENRNSSVRKNLYERLHENALNDIDLEKFDIYYIASCDDTLCVNPLHTELKTRKAREYSWKTKSVGLLNQSIRSRKEST